MKELFSCIKNFPFHLIASIQNVWRNGVMTFSSIFAVMITLLMIGTIGIVALNVQEISQSIEQGISIYVKLERELTEDEELEVGTQIEEIDNIKKSEFSTKDDELTKLIEKYDDGAELFESYRDDNPLGSVYVVEVENPKGISKVAKTIEGIQGVKSTTYGEDATDTMIDTLELVQHGGTVFIIALGVIAIFMISNTIKITITTRQTEIAIMRMVGASNWYIRIPFMLEGMLIGFLGSLLPIVAIYFGYQFIFDMSGGLTASTLLTLMEPTTFILPYCGALVGLGSIVGFLGSLVSIHRFLKS